MSEVSMHKDQFLGICPTAQLINGEALAELLGLTAGVAQHSEEPWLHFKTRSGRELYVALKPYRHSISWNDIHAVGAANGGIELVKGGRRYRVRLLTGGNDNPYSGGTGYNPTGTNQSEWNRLMYSVHNGKHQDPCNDPRPGPWPLFDDYDMTVHYGEPHGASTWCQEEDIDGDDRSKHPVVRRVKRGGFGITYLTPANPSNNDPICGWRPVLELIGP